MATSNPFVSTQKASDATPAVLHPTVLLAITDHITRHALRKTGGPVAGIVMGQQNGREITLEHVMDLPVGGDEHGRATINQPRFGSQVELMRAVHKDRQLDLVGWYTVLDRNGPSTDVFRVHQQLLSMNPDSALVLLVFHLDELDELSAGSKLPVTIYETVYEPDESGLVLGALETGVTATGEPIKRGNGAAKTVGDDEQEDKEMKDATDTSMATTTAAAAAAAAAEGPRITAKFREIPYTIEASEVEMTSIDYVAQGVANAAAAGVSGATGSQEAAGAPSTAANTTAATTTTTTTTTSSSNNNANANASGNRDRAVAIESGNKGKRRLVVANTVSSEDASAGNDVPETATNDDLSTEDQETIAILTKRANAIRMLHARLQLLTKYLDAVAEQEAGNAPSEGVAASPQILRSIQALVHRLPLVVPPPVAGAFEEERQRESNDVGLVSLLLDDLMQSIATVGEVGGKFNAVEQNRSSRTQRGLKNANYAQFAMGSLGNSPGRPELPL